ncbi:hypothetical protein ACFXDJ_00135 [Streptomyces sp. NPDC059443]|uniref:hypothetical protein n=1 Tax=unclassified Streptomyces TaxID=2593676 RepID=UPI0036A53582
MAYQATEQSQPHDITDEMDSVAARFDAEIQKSDEKIAVIEESLHGEHERRTQLIEARDDALTVARDAVSVRHRAGELLKADTDLDAASTARLRVVPDEAPPSPPPSAHEDDRGGTDQTTGTPAQAAHFSDQAMEEPPNEVLVRGARMKEILTAVATRPDLDWGTADIAAVLDVTEDDPAGRRALRENLRNLAMRGVLERVTVEGDFHTYYRPRMNWRFV